MAKIATLIFTLVFIGVIVAALVGGYLVYQFYFISPDAGAEKQAFVITEGETVIDIAENLEAQGLIDHGLVFRIYVKWTKTGSDFLAGAFELEPNLSMASITSTLTSTEMGVLKATIIEGWTLSEIGEYYENKGLLPTDELYKSTGVQATDYRNVSGTNPAEKWKDEFHFLGDKPYYVSLDGYLFPDTYLFFYNTKADDVIRKMLENFDNKLKPEWREEIERQGKSIFEIITMASIIEKEMYGLEARKMVSDIFWKRLEIGMALQSDASVNYVTGKGLTRPSLEDTRVESLYNTYEYPGLPLGPISNPGAEAIEAAIYPTSNEYYYFLNTPEGNIIYSKTHDEHVENKQKYLR